MFTVLLTVSADEVMANYSAYHEWVQGLRSVIGADTTMNNDAPWAVGDLHGRWREDHYGHRYFDRSPYVNVWQTGIGGDVASAAMAYVWAAIHLVQPLEAAGYSINSVWAGRSDEMVAIA